jgi:cytidine deaminase
MGGDTESTGPKVHRPELFFGLVGAVGTDIEATGSALSLQLARTGYKAEQISISGLMTSCHQFGGLAALIEAPEDERIDQFMKAGDKLRRDSSRGDIMALFAMSKVRNIRKKNNSDANRPLDAQAYIFRSLKHPAEIQTLRRVYGASFFVVSVYSPKAIRRERLSEKIARSRGGFIASEYYPQADQLILRDEKEIGDELGQNVRDAFPEADVFVDGSDIESHDRQIARFVDILFGHPFLTPRVAEYGMFHAKAAALRSADLSRQVGAVIATENGEIIAAGCNEVPQAGGGSVWDEDGGCGVNDNRDHVVGHDSAVRMRNEILTEIFDRLRESNWLSQEKADRSNVELITEALFQSQKPPLKGTRVASIIEFGRIVHAEMAAITEAARRGASVKGATLYCTTFPCHMCARHIVSAGIARVVYIEPYPKSMAKELYKNTISVDKDPSQIEGSVKFDSFVGIAPRAVQRS